jgi:serine/threonine-protein kinase HipA
MTSDRSDLRECFVYLTLPGAAHAVTCGRLQLSTDRRGQKLGRFVYGRRYLARPDAVAIDPVELQFKPRVYETAAFGGIFPALRDAAPDYWGRLLIERHAGRGLLDELDYLLAAPDDRAGALGFGLGPEPPAPRKTFNQTLQLAHLQELADALLESDSPGSGAEAMQAAELLLLGTSMGGARPKAVVEDDDGLWLAKFNRRDDRWNVARVEHAMLALAASCGISAAQSKVVQVGGRDVLLVRRFDRQKTPQGYTRARMVSALTLLRSGESPTERERWSYVLLAEELRRVCAQPKKEGEELFRRMCFNALISNTDDHPRNHAVLAPEREWRLSPAYDLVPSGAVSLEHRDLALVCGDLGRWANGRNLLSQSARFLVEPEKARALVDEMHGRVRETWYAVARAHGVSEADCARIAGAFAYAGFQVRA